MSPSRPASRCPEVAAILAACGPVTASCARLVALYGPAAGLMLRQALHWQGVHGPGAWWHQARANWEAQTGLTRWQQETARQRLAKDGVLVETRQGAPRGTMRYRVDLGRVREVLGIQMEVSPPSAAPDGGVPSNQMEVFPPNTPSVPETSPESDAADLVSALRAVYPAHRRQAAPKVAAALSSLDRRWSGAELLRRVRAWVARLDDPTSRYVPGLARLLTDRLAELDALEPEPDRTARDPLEVTRELQAAALRAAWDELLAEDSPDAALARGATVVELGAGVGGYGLVLSGVSADDGERLERVLRERLAGHGWAEVTSEALRSTRAGETKEDGDVSSAATA